MLKIFMPMLLVLSPELVTVNQLGFQTDHQFASSAAAITASPFINPPSGTLIAKTGSARKDDPIVPPPSRAEDPPIVPPNYC